MSLVSVGVLSYAAGIRIVQHGSTQPFLRCQCVRMGCVPTRVFAVCRWDRLTCDRSVRAVSYGQYCRYAHDFGPHCPNCHQPVAGPELQARVSCSTASPV